MQSAKALVSILLVFLLMAAPTAGADKPAVAGQWKLAVQTPNGINNPVLTIHEQDGAWSGTYAGPRGTFELRTILVEGSTFSFPLTVEMPIGAIELSYKGTVTGDRIEGVVGNPRGEIPFSGERIIAP
ncbi:MAG: hypothetical protein FJ194_16870 [Gammaproteobacteria bacterium]|nr:hypothetical protein [Gammaproteobacteria bacterium]